MFSLLFQSVKTVTYENQTFNGGDEETILLKPGDYTFYVYGSQGGDAYRNGEHTTSEGIGGKGAFVKGDYHITTTTSIKVIVGVAGSRGYPGPNPGGFPDGGSGGEDTGDNLFSSDKDASGGGGGSSQILKGSTKLIVAAGGSGAAGTMDGCPGGGYNTVYCSTNSNTCVSKNPTATQSYGVEPTYSGTFGVVGGQGGNGIDSAYTPGSGGGGGYYGGRNTNQDSITDYFQSVACSGSSYYNLTYIKNQSVLSGYQSGNGFIKIQANYLCMEECSDCQSSVSCTKCSGQKGLLNGRCVDKCPTGQTIYNNICEKCTNNCSECSINDLNNCTKCPEYYELRYSKDHLGYCKPPTTSIPKPYLNSFFEKAFI